jgi:BNR repeat-containing family member
MTRFFTHITSWFTRRPSQSKVIATHAEPERVTGQNDTQSLVPYDENLLECSRSQWQFGDWQNLAKLSLETLQHHPDRAKLALLCAAGHAQLGHTEPARQFTRLAQDWGCSKKIISQVLISGVHNSLARAAAAAGQTLQTRQHFEQAIHTGAPHLDANLLAPARAQQQLTDMGLVAQSPWLAKKTDDTHNTHNTHEAEKPAPHALPHSLPPPSCSFTPFITAQHPLGMAWAGNTINTVIFRHHGILTYQGLQTTAFYVDDHTLRLVQRHLATQTLHTYDLLGHYNLKDAHNSISLGVDRAGHLHISYDHHATHLHYRRSTAPNTITHWTDELAMTGVHEEQVTYPTFILPHHGYPLTLLYRDGVHNKGTARLKTYDESSQIWADHPQAILSGAEQKPWTSNAYWNHPAVGTDGTLHLSFVWRTHTLGEEHRINNINICYARSANNGLNWTTSQGRAYQLPITQVNAETIHPVSPGCNLMNQCSMALDSRNHPHIVFYADDANAIPQYQHLRFDGKSWHHQVISDRTQAFNLQGDGTLQIPISRPDIVLDEHDNAYVIYRGDLTHNRMVATYLPAPHYTLDHTSTLWPDDLGFAEPVLDRTRWQQDHTLSLLLQCNEQPNHDQNHQPIDQPIFLVDFKAHADPLQKH